MILSLEYYSPIIDFGVNSTLRNWHQRDNLRHRKIFYDIIKYFLYFNIPSQENNSFSIREIENVKIELQKKHGLVRELFFQVPTMYHFMEIQGVLQEALSQFVLPKSHLQIPWSINPSPPSIFNT